MKSIFILVIFVTAVAHANVDELVEKVKATTGECAAKTNFSEEGINKLRAGDLTDAENVQCFHKCFFETSGIVTENGFNNDEALSIAKIFKRDEGQIKANLIKCAPLYKADTFDCEAAWEIYKCIHSNQ